MPRQAPLPQQTPGTVKSSLPRRLLLGNFRIVYRLSQWFGRRFSTAGGMLLGGLVASAVFGINTRQTLSYQVAALLFAILAIAFISRLIRWRSRFSVQRTLPEFATALTPISYTVSITNLGARMERDLTLRERLDDSLPSLSEFSNFHGTRDTPTNWFDTHVGFPRWMEAVKHKRGATIAPHPIPTLGPGESVDLKIELTPRRRGYLKFANSDITCPDPLGLMLARRPLATPGSLLVLPQRYQVPTFKASGRRKYQRGGVAQASVVGESQEFMSLRDYRPGDPLRHIHWKSWAKTGKPVVKEYQDEFFDRQALLLDTFSVRGCDATFEAAVAVAASIACSDWSADALLELMFIGPQTVRMTAGRGLADTRHLLEVLACASPAKDHDFAHLSAMVMQHADEMSAITLVLIDWDESRRALLRRLLPLAVPLVVFLIRPSGEDAPIDPAPVTGRLFTLRCASIAEDLAAIDTQALANATTLPP